MAQSSEVAVRCDSVAEAVDQLRARSTQPDCLANVIIQYKVLAETVRRRSRELSKWEKSIFDRNGNVGTLRVSYLDESLVEADLARIRFCTFSSADSSVLFQHSDEDDDDHPNIHVKGRDWTIEHSNMNGSIIERGATVSRCTNVVKCLILSNASILGCGSVRGPEDSSNIVRFGNGIKVSPGLETNGRAIAVVLDNTFEQIARVTLEFARFKQAKAAYDEVIKRYCMNCESSFTIIDHDATLLNAIEVVNSYVGVGAQVTSGARVRSSSIGAWSTVEQGSDVIDSLVQSRCQISTQSIVKASIVCSSAHVETHGKVLASVLGPGASVAEGEVTASLLGPLVGFHHQSLLIATYWPAGRGNVGYGANLGSNHTSRVSDQSFWPGEGVFFGLSSCAKLPVNMLEAPYSIVATGVVFGPGRLNMPFSLVTNDENGRTRVAPGWCLISNAYFIERGAMKMTSRAPPGYSGQVLRPEIMIQVLRAKLALEACLKKMPEHALETGLAAIEETRYGESLGLNLLNGYVTHKDAMKGVKAYTFILELYLLRVAKQLGDVRLDKDPVTVPFNVLCDPDPASTGIDLKATSVKEMVAVMWRAIFPAGIPIVLYKSLLDRERAFAKSVLESKARDHLRGQEVFPPGRYEEVIDLEADPVILNARARVSVLEREH